MIPSRSEVTTGFVDMVSRGTRKLVGDGETPPSLPTLDADPERLNDAFPFCVVYSVDGPQIDGPPLQGDVSDADFVFQVTSVGLSRAQCEWMADAVRRTVLTTAAVPGEYQVPLTVPTGWRCNGRLPNGGPGGVDSVGTSPKRMFNQIERFTVRITPA